MKSLEIVSKLINQSKRGMLIDNNEEELEQIKADLEVLEIINNKHIDLAFLKFVLVKLDDLDEILETYNYGSMGDRLTLEELLKLKQWLEENENDN